MMEQQTKTASLLEKYKNQVQVITHPANRGKGVALRNAFSYALSAGYDYAIAIDSDGQHFPSDLPSFINAIAADPDALLIGSRNMDQEGIPGRSSFGNKFSNFWFKVETGIQLSDTQSGYRLYPIRKMEAIRYFTNRFEFEIEAIVKAAWRGIRVKNIPVKIYYQPGNERVSHFRPFTDFSRISLLNTWFVILALAYYIPLRFVRSLTRENIRKFINTHFFNPHQPPHIKALSIGFGAFMGIFPVWGYQMIIGLAVSHFFKLNKALFLVAANISLPPLIPFILFASHRVGYYLVANPTRDLFFNNGLTLEAVKTNLFQYVVGAVVLSLGMGILFGVVSYIYFLCTSANRNSSK